MAENDNKILDAFMEKQSVEVISTDRKFKVGIMCPMIDEYYSPFMCRDMMASGMGMPFIDPSMMGMYGAGMYNTNYLGGVALPPRLNNDTFHIINAKEQKSRNGLKTLGKAVLGILGYLTVMACFKGKSSKGCLSGIKSSLSSGWGKFTGLFKKGSTP